MNVHNKAVLATAALTTALAACCGETETSATRHQIRCAASAAPSRASDGIGT